MNRLGLDFVHRPRSPWPARLLLAVALAVSLDMALSYKSLRGAVTLGEARLAKAQPRSAPGRKVSAEELAAVRETVDRLATPWDRLFAALESAASDQVALLGIQPDPKAGTVVISGDSKDYLAALGDRQQQRDAAARSLCRAQKRRRPGEGRAGVLAARRAARLSLGQPRLAQCDGAAQAFVGQRYVERHGERHGEQ